jgi:magnesium chelatase subunit ChlD-like protein
VEQAGQLLQRHCGADPSCQGWLWLLTDGRTRERPTRPMAAWEAAIVDFESGRVRLGRAGALAVAWGARHVLAGDFPQAGTQGAG